MAEISRTEVTAAAPAAVWALLSDFGALAAWADGVDHSCLLNHVEAEPPVGLARRVQIGRDTFVETITAWDPQRVLAYAITGLPRGWAVSNRWNLAPDGVDATSVTLTGTVRVSAHPLRPLAERILLRLMARRSDALLHSLAVTAERGSP